jgi:hypothetical protein
MTAAISDLKPIGLQPVQHLHGRSQRTNALTFDRHDDQLHVLLCASGSVATIKIPNMVSALAKHTKVRLRLVFTNSAANFLQGQSAEQPSIADLEAFPNVEAVYFDADEWAEPWVRGNKILHIELRRWADIMVIAPLSANELAKITQGCPSLGYDRACRPGAQSARCAMGGGERRGWREKKEAYPRCPKYEHCYVVAASYKEAAACLRSRMGREEWRVVRGIAAHGERASMWRYWEWGHERLERDCEHH